MLCFKTKLITYLFWLFVFALFCFTDKYLYLHGGKEQSRQFISPPIHAAEAKCIRFWFKSEGKYFTRSLQLVIKSSDSISLSPIWSVDEETPKWTFMQIPLQYIANEFQVGSYGLFRIKSYTSMKFQIGCYTLVVILFARFNYLTSHSHFRSRNKKVIIK